MESLQQGFRGGSKIFIYVLVDNLQPEIALDSISLPKTKQVELGKTLPLTPTFSPENTTNKIVTWTSSDESVATIDNAGKITPKKIGSTIITVTSQDGNKKATCTVTVVGTSSNNNTQDNNNNTGTNNNSNNGNTNNSGTTNNGIPNNSNTDGKKYDTTVVTGKLPQTGLGMGLISTIVLLIGGSMFAYIKYSKLRDI